VKRVLLKQIFQASAKFIERLILGFKLRRDVIEDYFSIAGDIGCLWRVQPQPDELIPGLACKSWNSVEIWRANTNLVDDLPNQLCWKQDRVFGGRQNPSFIHCKQHSTIRTMVCGRTGTVLPAKACEGPTRTNIEALTSPCLRHSGGS